MNCPNDATTLLMSERHGVEIDYCPSCRGVWLDRGELDKILDQVRAGDEVRETQARSEGRGDDWRDDRRSQSYERSNEGGRYSNDQRYRGKRKKNPLEFLGDLFEG